ncbi:helix-turn-helix domain-containing protein [Uliginosibacterium gangwonense]|uniref:helix-turn-helix domain-containing protein n=1 Tax=Uliginosibacterium gangwonense TaxID=392736 RepID=UPI0003761FE4|nr:RodZ domain-containing protein [Uliginosibacterium gangwonense]
MSEDKNNADAIPAEVWDRLRQAREAMGLSIGDVSAYLKLTVRQIEAIEHGELDALPGAAFARGFVRNYARFLGLDPAEFLQAKDTTGLAPDADSATLAARINPTGLGTIPFKRRLHMPWLPMALGVLLLFILLSVAWHFRWLEPKDDELLAQLQSEPAAVGVSGVVSVASAPVQAASEVVASAPAASSPLPAAESAPVVAASPVAVPASSAPAVVRQSAPALPVAAASPVVVSPSVAVPASAPAAAQSANASNLSLAFEGDSWVVVRDATGKTLMSRLNAAGSSQILQGTPPLAVVVGNARHVKLIWRGKPVDLAPYTKIDVAKMSLQ